MKHISYFRRFIIFSLIICLLLACSSVSYAEEVFEDPDQLLEEGKQLLSNNDTQDLIKGISYILRAAKDGSAKAMIEVGNMYIGGLGRIISDDFEEGSEATIALSWYEKAADAGEKDLAASVISSTAFSYFLGTEDGTIKEDDAIALMYFQKAAEYGDPSAINMMVAFYVYGFGVDQDPDKALELCSSLADKGDPEALYAMEDYAYAYYAGTKDGLDINFGTSFKFYEQLTKYGNERAMYNIGLLYEYGLGTSRDHEKAVDWLTKAQSAGYEPAKNMLDSLASKN